MGCPVNRLQQTIKKPKITNAKGVPCLPKTSTNSVNCLSHEVLKFLTENSKRDKDAFAYVDYDFLRMEWSNPMDLDIIDTENHVKSFVYDYSDLAIYALEKEKNLPTT